MPNAEVWPANTLMAEKCPKIPASDEANDDEHALTSARTRHVHQTGRWKATGPNQVLLTPHCDFHLIVAPTAWSASHYVHHENATRKPSWTATETACVILMYTITIPIAKSPATGWITCLHHTWHPLAPCPPTLARPEAGGSRHLYTVNTRRGCWMEISILFKDNGRSRTWRNWNNSGFSVDAYLRAGTPPETKRFDMFWFLGTGLVSRVCDCSWCSRRQWKTTKSRVVFHCLLEHQLQSQTRLTRPVPRNQNISKQYNP